MPSLRVGLHLNLTEGHPVLSETEVPRLLHGNGEFDQNMLRAAARFSLHPGVRRQLAAEIRAQFEAFRATSLRLDHVNGHKHVHLHPGVSRLLIEIGRDYGLQAVRVPSEPVALLRRAFPDERFRTPAYHPWVVVLRRRLQRAGLRTNDHLFGIAWSGGMIESRFLRLMAHLPEGVSEIYCHPAAQPAASLSAAAPGYGHAKELAALLSPAVRRCVGEHGISVIGYGDLGPP
jgi:hopanoid biosynthesis associated protein HpnK